jgi:hypothetical protein
LRGDVPDGVATSAVTDQVTVRRLPVLAAEPSQIQAAVNIVGPGQTVQIGEGSYPEEVDVTRSCTAAVPITIMGPNAYGAEEGHIAWVGGASKPHGITIVGASYIQVQDLRFESTTGDGGAGAGSTQLIVDVFGYYANS